MILAVCHAIVVDPKTGKYNASSPDELALVEGAKRIGSSFEHRDSNRVITVARSDGVRMKFQLLQVLEFTSDRKRMSVIVKNQQTDEIVLMTKGADNIIKNLLRED